MSHSSEIARQVISIAKARGWIVEVDNEIFRARKPFTPKNLDAYLQADTEWYSFVTLIDRTRPGSTWGTTSDGVGGHSALERGCYEINMSGGSKRILKAISKLVN
jgi:hypothetical protein